MTSPRWSRPRHRVGTATAGVLLAATGVLGLGSLAAAGPAAAVVSPSPSATPAATSTSTPTPTVVSSSVTETTTATRRPLPGWAIAVVAALAVGGAVAAYPATRGR